VTSNEDGQERKRLNVPLFNRWFVSRSLYDQQGVEAEKEIGRLNAVVNRQFGEKDDLDDDLADAENRLSEIQAINEMLLAELREKEDQGTSEKEPVTQEQYDKMLAARCAHCGGVHSVSCPRVKRIRFRGDGQSPLEIEFWPDEQWPKDRVKWIENLEVEVPTP
jgi:hypothetical protein